MTNSSSSFSWLMLGLFQNLWGTCTIGCLTWKANKCYFSTASLIWPYCNNNLIIINNLLFPQIQRKREIIGELELFLVHFGWSPKACAFAQSWCNYCIRLHILLCGIVFNKALHLSALQHNSLVFSLSYPQTTILTIMSSQLMQNLK